MEDKLLKPYKGFSIDKSWEEYPDGSKHNIIYTAYTKDSYSVFDAAKTLSELKKKIDRYVRLKNEDNGNGGYYDRKST